jgi:hypothetical protein
MKKLLAILAATAMFAGASQATAVVEKVEWDQVNWETPTGTSYTDTSTIETINGYTWYWELKDFKRPIVGGKYLSSMLLVQAYCGSYYDNKLTLRSDRRNRVKYEVVEFYKKAMGKGNVGKQLNDFEWEYVKEGSNLFKTLDFACKFKKK